MRTYEVVGWISPEGLRSTGCTRWLGTLEDVRSAVIAESIDLIVCAPGAGDAGGLGSRASARRSPTTASTCPVRLIAANQLYEEIFGHVPVGMIDAAWYRYIMHPRFRAAARTPSARSTSCSAR